MGDMEYTDYDSLEHWIEARWKVWQATLSWPFDEMVCGGLDPAFVAFPNG
jgi:hypothetical protein